MSTLQDERQAIVDALDGLAVAHDHVPGRINPPTAVVSPGSPYLGKTDADTFRSYTVQFEVIVIVRPGDNQKVTRELDEHIEIVTSALLDAGFGVDQAGAPYPLETSNTTYLAAALTTTTTITL